ncbi:MAG: hypothetical protein IM466_06845, partial [Microcystis sp. M04BS1]|nr:hypothetical protein [Microcystis sp. M04BS1]
MRYKVSRSNTSKIIMGLIFSSLFMFPLFWLLSWIPVGITFFIMFNNSHVERVGEILNFIVFIIAVAGTIMWDIFWYFYLIKLSLGEALSNAYRWSIREALQTTHPDGIIYILDNVLKQFDKFNLNLQPQRTNYNQSRTKSHADSGISYTYGISDVKGFPNRTNLKETINMAQTLSQEIAKLNLAEKSRAMGEIRDRIQAEDMWLDWKTFDLTNKYDLDVYWYSYTEEDH